MVNIKELVDVENATQSRRIFWDQEIYQLELERIFARCWLFLTHESQIPNFGDFVVTKMGEDEVVVWRQRDGSIKVFLNQCTHRGMKLCMAEAGNARGFSCGYHGWAFNVEGELASVPLQERAYSESFDRCNLGLREVPKVDSYRGFIFACMDSSAPSLLDYLGDKAWYMDVWSSVPGGIELIGPPSRSIIHANWKVPTENFIGDAYHVGWTHASAMVAAVGSTIPQETFVADEMDVGLQATSRYGHGMGVNKNFFGPMMLVEDCPELTELIIQQQADVTETHGEKAAGLVPGNWDGSIFPNCSYLYGANIFKVWHPLGPDKIEIMTWTIGGKEMSDDLKQRLQVATHRYFGTGGILEGDDIDSFEYGNKPNAGYITRQGRLNLQMGLGTDREDEYYPGVVGDYINELAQRGFYRAYADFLSSSNWLEVEANTAKWKEDLLPKQK